MPDRNAPRPGKPNIGKTGFSQATIANFAEYLHSLGFAPSTVQQYVGIASVFGLGCASQGDEDSLPATHLLRHSSVNTARPKTGTTSVRV